MGEGADGVRAYSSKRVPGAKCVVASQYKGGAQAAPVSATPALLNKSDLLGRGRKVGTR